MSLTYFPHSAVKADVMDVKTSELVCLQAEAYTQLIRLRFGLTVWMAVVHMAAALLQENCLQISCNRTTMDAPNICRLSTKQI